MCSRNISFATKVETSTDVRYVKARLHQASLLTLRQLCNDASDTVLKKNGLQPQSGGTPLISMRTGLLASSQNCFSVDADAQW